ARQAARNSAMVGEFHGRTFRNTRRHALGVPIRKSHAAVGLRLRHLSRRGRAVDSVSFRRQVDPYCADGVVGPGLDRERLIRTYALEVVVRIVAVGRVAADLGHLQRTGRRRLLVASDRGWIKADPRVLLVEKSFGSPR